MKLINKKISYSEKQLFKHKATEWMIIVFVLIITFVFVWYFVVSMDWSNAPLISSLIFMAIGVVFGFIYSWIIKKIGFFLARLDYKKYRSRVGAEGENIVYKELDKILDDSYYVCRNYQIPGHKFDLDFLVLGPKGLVVIEVKNFSNSTVFLEDRVVSIKNYGYKQESRELFGKADPRVSLDIHCRYLNNYLNYLGYKNIKIKKVLVFPNDHITIEGSSKTYIVKKLNELDKYFTSAYLDERFTREFCESIIDKLN